MILLYNVITTYRVFKLPVLQGPTYKSPHVSKTSQFDLSISLKSVCVTVSIDVSFCNMITGTKLQQESEGCTNSTCKNMVKPVCSA